MVGHLDAVGLHGVARAIVKVAHVRVVEVGHALLDHLGAASGEDFLGAAQGRARRALALLRVAGAPRRAREGPCRRAGAILAAGHPGALTRFESVF